MATPQRSGLGRFSLKSLFVIMVGMVILGVFFFQIREQFDSLDIRHMERERERAQEEAKQQ